MPVTTLPTSSRRGFALSLAGAGASILLAHDGPEHWALLSDTHIPADPANGHRGFRPTDNLAKVVPQVLEAGPVRQPHLDEVAVPAYRRWMTLSRAARWWYYVFCCARFVPEMGEKNPGDFSPGFVVAITRRGRSR